VYTRKRSLRAWIQRLQLEYDEVLSSFAFNLNLRRYAVGANVTKLAVGDKVGVGCMAGELMRASTVHSPDVGSYYPPPRVCMRGLLTTNT